jgi:hypothetical protein
MTVSDFEKSEWPSIAERRRSDLGARLRANASSTVATGHSSAAKSELPRSLPWRTAYHSVKQIKIIVEKHADGYVAYPVGLKGSRRHGLMPRFPVDARREQFVRVQR